MQTLTKGSNFRAQFGYCYVSEYIRGSLAIVDRTKTLCGFLQVKQHACALRRTFPALQSQNADVFEDSKVTPDCRATDSCRIGQLAQAIAHRRGIGFPREMHVYQNGMWPHNRLESIIQLVILPAMPRLALISQLNVFHVPQGTTPLSDSPVPAIHLRDTADLADTSKQGSCRVVHEFGCAIRRES